MVSTRPALKDSPTSQHAPIAPRPVAKCAASKHKLKEKLEGLSIGELVELYKKFSLADAAAALPGGAHSTMLSASARGTEGLLERCAVEPERILSCCLPGACSLSRRFESRYSKAPSVVPSKQVHHRAGGRLAARPCCSIRTVNASRQAWLCAAAVYAFQCIGSVVRKRDPAQEQERARAATLRA